jgi:hypothetical protein
VYVNLTELGRRINAGSMATVPNSIAPEGMPITLGEDGSIHAANTGKIIPNAATSIVLSPDPK